MLGIALVVKEKGKNERSRSGKRQEKCPGPNVDEQKLQRTAETTIIADESSFEAKESLCGAVVVLALVGRMTTPPQRQAILNRARFHLSEGRSRFAFELSGLEWASPVLLGASIELHRLAGETGGKIVWANPNSRMCQVVELSRLGEVIKIYPSLEAAVEVCR